MPRHRGTTVSTGTLIGRLIILVAAGKQTSDSLAGKLKVSRRQVNRYIEQLNAAGWQIERVGEWRRGEYHFELTSPKLVISKRK